MIDPIYSLKIGLVTLIGVMGVALVYIHYYPVSLGLPKLPSIHLQLPERKSTTPSVAPSPIADVEKIPVASAKPIASNAPATSNYDNHYFSLTYPTSWTQSIPPAPGTVTSWQITAIAVSLEIAVKKASYTYESYQFHVSSITNNPSKNETYSSMTENTLNGVRTLSYTHTTLKGGYTEVTWFESNGFEYYLTWSVTGTDPTNRDLLVIQNQDMHDAIFHSLTLP